MKSSESTPGTSESPKQMAIFELLSYIVDQPPPQLPARAFSHELIDFIECCLKKNPKERNGLDALTRHEFISVYEPEESIDLGHYIRTVLGDND